LALRVAEKMALEINKSRSSKLEDKKNGVNRKEGEDGGKGALVLLKRLLKRKRASYYEGICLTLETQRNKKVAERPDAGRMKPKAVWI